MGHDGLGRCAFEYDSLDAVRSRRDYTYLPNGQLGTIAGKTAGNVAWTVTMRYDERGRPLTIVYSGGDSIELFWDESDRLIDTAITHASPISGVTIVRWHYHYVGGTLLAASRELSTPPVAPATKPTIAVKRFWVITDERGLPHRLLDEQGAEYWKATWDASGWRTMQTQAAEMNWMPFGLPGQLVLRDTEAYASGTEGGTTVTRFRAPLILNQWRAYDALTGTYLQPDGADVLGRSDPEGYAYARSSPIEFFDPSAQATYMGNMLPAPAFPGCSSSQRLAISAHLLKAAMNLAKCTEGLCGELGGRAFRAAWLQSLLLLRYECVSPWFGQATFSGRVLGLLNGYLSDGVNNNILGITSSKKMKAALSINSFLGFGGCLALTLGHEALHPVFKKFYLDDLMGDTLPHITLEEAFGPKTLSIGSFVDEVDPTIEDTAVKCKLCD